MSETNIIRYNRDRNTGKYVIIVDQEQLNDLILACRALTTRRKAVSNHKNTVKRRKQDVILDADVDNYIIDLLPPEEVKEVKIEEPVLIPTTDTKRSPVLNIIRSI